MTRRTPLIDKQAGLSPRPAAIKPHISLWMSGTMAYATTRDVHAPLGRRAPEITRSTVRLRIGTAQPDTHDLASKVLNRIVRLLEVT